MVCVPFEPAPETSFPIRLTLMSINSDPDPVSLANSLSASPGIEPLPKNIQSIQPGGGFCMACELAWGYGRRAYLRTLRRSYLRRMRGLRKGGEGIYPHDLLDPRDLKFYCNQGDIHWDRADDPFAWRNKLPFARVGLAEIVIICGGLLGLFALIAYLFWPLAIVPLGLTLFVLWFFRDPPRQIPREPGQVVAPADGQVFSIREVEHDEQFDGPAIVIDIFLSIFNVHINRAPIACRVLGIAYHRGKFLNALRPEAALENESLELRIASLSVPQRVMRVRQITGAIARRIVCWVRPGDDLPRGGQFGMIKLGSRTELTLPKEPGLELLITKGQKVRAGSTVMARYGHDRTGNDADGGTPS